MIPLQLRVVVVVNYGMKAPITICRYAHVVSISGHRSIAVVGVPASDQVASAQAAHKNRTSVRHIVTYIAISQIRMAHVFEHRRNVVADTFYLYIPI